MQCAGIWIKREDVERLMKFRDTDVEQEAKHLVGAAFILGPPRNRDAMIACPECSAPMRRAAVPDTRHAVDVCEAHGTWFDREELPAFVGAYAAARAGEVDEDDLRAAGIPSHGRSDGDDDDDGFFTGMFRNLWRMMK